MLGNLNEVETCLYVRLLRTVIDKNFGSKEIDFLRTNVARGIELAWEILWFTFDELNLSPEVKGDLSGQITILAEFAQAMGEHVSSDQATIEAMEKQFK